MTTTVRKPLKWWIGVLIVSILLFPLDSCMQLRMSKSEIDSYFGSRNLEPHLYTYPVGTNRVIQYLKVGSDDLPRVIFVHGSPGSLSAFISFMSDTTLLKRAQLYSVDRPGFGSSDFGRAEISLEKQAEYLKPILADNPRHRPTIVVGHSLGGPVICRMAMDYQQLIDGLIIVAGAIDPDLEPKGTWRFPLATPFLKWMLPRSFRASNEEIYRLKPELIKMIPLWDKITCPVIFIQGKKDHLVAPGNADYAKKMLTHAAELDFVFKEDMDHYVPWSDPILIHDAILAMLDKVGHQ